MIDPTHPPPAFPVQARKFCEGTGHAILRGDPLYSRPLNISKKSFLPRFCRCLSQKSECAVLRCALPCGAGKVGRVGAVGPFQMIRSAVDFFVGPPPCRQDVDPPPTCTQKKQQQGCVYSGTGPIVSIQRVGAGESDELAIRWRQQGYKGESDELAEATRQLRLRDDEAAIGRCWALPQPGNVALDCQADCTIYPCLSANLQARTTFKFKHGDERTSRPRDPAWLLPPKETNPVLSLWIRTVSRCGESLSQNPQYAARSTQHAARSTQHAVRRAPSHLSLPRL